MQPTILTTELMAVLISAIRAANLVPFEQVNLDCTSDPVWEGSEEITLFHESQAPIDDQEETLGYANMVRMDVMAATLDDATALLEKAMNVVESIPNNVFFRESQAAGKGVGGRKVDNAFIAACNYTIYTKG